MFSDNAVLQQTRSKISRISSKVTAPPDEKDVRKEHSDKTILSFEDGDPEDPYNWSNVGLPCDVPVEGLD